MADPETLVPRASGSLDGERLRSLPLAPVDGFILSRVDGTLTVGDLAQLTGVPVDGVLASVRKLEALGVVRLEEHARTDPPTRPLRLSPAPPAGGVRVTSAPPPKITSIPPAPPPPRITPPPAAPPSAPPGPQSAPFVPVADVDLEPDHQREIARFHSKLEVLDHYTLLGVPRSADKKAIKRAYFERTARFHPDRFFRKRLGPFKLQMEAVFTRMTEAHDTLTHPERRAEYDGYLASRAKSRDLEAMLAEATAEFRRAEEEALDVKLTSIPPPPASAPNVVNAAVARAPSSPPATGAARSDPPPPSSPPGQARMSAPPKIPAHLTDPFASPPTTQTKISILPPASGASAEQSRRDALARRLTGGSGVIPAAKGGSGVTRAPPAASAPSPSAPSAPFRAPAAPKVPSLGGLGAPDRGAGGAAPAAPPPSNPPPKAAEAVDALKRRYAEKVTHAKAAQIRKYSEAGVAARASKDWIAAANAFKVALSFDEDNASLQSAYEECQRHADLLLADQYVGQAEYEERAEHWAEAARSWQRVARARENDARAADRAAHCLVKADGNLHDAAALAQRAIQVAPREPKYRLTLANVYLAAGLTKNAKRELEAAAQLAPDDAAIQALLKRVMKSA